MIAWALGVLKWTPKALKTSGYKVMNVTDMELVLTFNKTNKTKLNTP